MRNSAIADDDFGETLAIDGDRLNVRVVEVSAGVGQLAARSSSHLC
jgi:hypothetical protein